MMPRKNLSLQDEMATLVQKIVRDARRNKEMTVLDRVRALEAANKYLITTMTKLPPPEEESDFERRQRAYYGDREGGAAAPEAAAPALRVNGNAQPTESGGSAPDTLYPD